jgi:uncharacterized repeat protein (TIGR01451 family)
MLINQTRTLLVSFGLSATVLLAIILTGAFGSTQRSLAITNAPAPTLTVVSSPAAPMIGDTLAITLTVTNPGANPLTAVTLTQTLNQPLPLPSLSADDPAFTCKEWPCPNLTLKPGSTTITATYRVVAPALVGQIITHTSSLSMPALSEAITRTAATRAVQIQRVFLPLLWYVVPDLYADWVKLTPPAAGAAVNYLYVSQAEDQCSGPATEQDLPSTILAATNSGIYRLRAATTIGDFGDWELLGGTGALEVSHIISTTSGYFAGAFNQGQVFRSTDDGATWSGEDLPDNQRVYWLAATDERIFAAGSQGLYIRASDGTWAAEPQISGAVFSVAAAGQTVYAVQMQVGARKHTLLHSTAGGAIGTWLLIGELPGAANFIQTLYASQRATPTLLIGTVGNGLYQYGLFQSDGSRLGPLALDPGLTVYGIWRDGRGRIYASYHEPGGLQRFMPRIGGIGEALHTLPGAAPSTAERLFTVNGNPGSQCGIIMTGSREGNVWLRRIP